MSRPMSYEPNNGPKIAIDPIPENMVLDLLKKNNVPDCEGTVVCRLKGSTRYCKCRKSLPTLELSEESPIPDSEGTVVCILVSKIVILVHNWQF